MAAPERYFEKGVNMANVNDFVKGKKKMAFKAVDLVGFLNAAGAGLPVPEKVANNPQR
ncbi:MAG: hypothetical protein J5611_03790 [Alphaproteobacteria bacterium]|jgi:hypothetical protein|nr:hypothetical protein [Alphaproteobacteria bacterium]